MDFWEAVRAQVKKNGTKLEAAAEAAGISPNTLSGWISKGRLPRLDEAAKLARVLGTSLDQLLSDSGPIDQVLVRNARGDIVDLDGDAFLVPILAQTVAAGHGQELLNTQEIIGQLPFLRRMLRGGDPVDARALEVRGDSMTGVNIFDGDLVVFVPGIIRGDGIYVLQVGDELIVKRVEFDQVSRKLRIMSENPRYPDKVESADGQSVSVVGKVYGWVHAHPY